MRYRNRIEVPREPQAVFAYLADFANTSEWDPGISNAQRLSEPPTRVGSRFELTAVFRGKPQRFEYVVTEYDEGRRIALHGDGEKATSEDTITVEPAANGTAVSYEADLRLKGIFRLAEPLLGRTFARMGDDALAGLAAKLGA